MRMNPGGLYNVSVDPNIQSSSKVARSFELSVNQTRTGTSLNIISKTQVIFILIHPNLGIFILRTHYHRRISLFQIL